MEQRGRNPWQTFTSPNSGKCVEVAPNLCQRLPAVAVWIAWQGGDRRFESVRGLWQVPAVQLPLLASVARFRASTSTERPAASVLAFGVASEAGCRAGLAASAAASTQRPRRVLARARRAARRRCSGPRRMRSDRPRSRRGVNPHRCSWRRTRHGAVRSPVPTNRRRRSCRRARPGGWRSPIEPWSPSRRNRCRQMRSSGLCWVGPSHS